jgi:hypothetical protein
MKKKQHRELLSVLASSLIGGIVFQYYFLSEFSVGVETISNIVTFLSIIFGFYITSFSIFTTSKFVSSLYDFNDPENIEQTMLHTVIFKYKAGLLIALFSIFYFIAIIFVVEKNEGSLPLNEIYSYPIFSIFLLNFIYAYLMFSILVDIIRQEAKHNIE